MKKKLLVLALLIAFGAVGLAACGGGGEQSQSQSSTKQVVYVEDINITNTNLTVNINETVKIEASISPSNASTRGLSYASADPSIATVSSSGVVTGVKAGETTITVTSKGTKADGTPATKTVKITVNEVFINDLSVRNASVTLQVNGTEQIEATITPENASNRELEYTTSDASVATVSAGGLIKGIKVGTATVTVKTKGKTADGKNLSKTIAVEVVSTALSELKIAQPTINFNIVGDDKHPTAKIEYEVLPSNASEKGVTFVSSDPAVASVSNDGVVTAQSVGETTITLTTVGTDASGNHLTGTVTVTVTSKVNVIEFRNADGTLLQGYAEDEIAEGVVPEFTADIPGKASDEENIYIFRGFDKEIKPYAKSTDTVVYTAVYEKTKSTPRLVTLTKEVGADQKEKIIFSVAGESKGVDTETIRNRAWIAFQEHTTHSWATHYSDPMAPIINADGSWVMQMELKDEDYGGGEIFMGKYVWNQDEASNPVDLKILHREDRLRYRHAKDTGEVVEDNQIGDSWDGILPDDYVATGNWGGGTSTNLSEEKRQVFADAVPAPTWVGLGVTYEPAKITIGDKVWELFTDDSVWFLPSVRVQDMATAKEIHLTEDGDKVYYTVSGQLASEGAVDEATLMKASMDFEHNGDVDGGSGFVGGVSGKSGPGITPEKVTINAEDFSLFFRVDNIEGIKDNDINGYYPHFAIRDVSASGERADFPSSVKRTSGESVVVGGYTYSIISASGNGAGYWGNPGLQIEKYVEAISGVSAMGYEVDGSAVKLHLKGAVKGLSGAAKLTVGSLSENVTLDANGNFDAKIDVSSLATNTGSGYSGDLAYDIAIEKDEVVHPLKSGKEVVADNLKIDEISVDGINYVFVNKGGRFKMTTVGSSFTSSRVALREEGGKAILHVNGVLQSTMSKDGLMLAVNTVSGDDCYKVAVPSNGINSLGTLDFDVDVTNFVPGSANNRLFLLNKDGRTFRNNDGRGVNWFWMNDWSLGLNEYGPVSVNEKTYTVSDANNPVLNAQ